MYYYAHLICKASVYKLVSELFLATSCLLYADTVPLRNDYKPKNLAELKAGIKQFWATLTPATCKKYISHLKKVIQR